ncbi:MAG TPA: hypothetical protein ENN20_04905 [Candidatus Marinimicrobia bacterium]|nr:hypothetical protein [Candidatus Neomarinimicrobiota bacterium]
MHLNNLSKATAVFFALMFTAYLTYAQSVSITDLRQNDRTGTPFHLDQVVTTSGVVTVAAEFGTAGPAYIQSEEAGIAIYGADLVAQLNSGDYISITSQVGFYNGLTQFVYDPENSAITVESSALMPAA